MPKGPLVLHLKLEPKLWFIDFEKQIKGLFHIRFGLGLPDVMDRGLGL